MKRFKRSGWHLMIALDQLVNVLLGGYADETLSSRIYRRATVREPRRRWLIARRAVNGMFWWQHDHCRGAYEMEIMRRHLPENFVRD